MSNPSGSNWTTNVNRVKTKRWVEAKSYSYDGDDWGDADEYGEYDEPQAAPKPTGLRKVTAPASSTTAPQPPIGQKERSNSFGRDDERRAFSGPSKTAYAQPQPSQMQPAAGYVPEQSQASQWSQTAPQANDPGRGPLLNASTPYDSRAGSMVSNISAPAAGRRKPSIGQTEQSSTVPPILTNVPPPAIGTPDKPSTPTLIRPADIYRRMQEEREKERLSQESSRPSLSGLTRDESPASKSDRSGRQPQGPILNTTIQHSAVPTSSSSNVPNANTVPPIIAAPTPLSPGMDNPRSKGPSNSPKLPEISGISGFGDDFGGSFMSSSDPVKKTISQSTVMPADTLSPSAAQNDPGHQSNLQHQPSFGYKSVVNQAFEQAVPPTPSSTSGSGVDRSNSDSTNNISPIISREVSSAVRPEGMSNISAIAEEPVGSSRPGTSGSTTKRKSVGANHPDSSTQATFIPGHRRETSLPDANNSPARTPALETNNELMKPQEAEMAVTTPVSDSYSQAGRDRSTSPTKSRVRDLVDKIDTANNSRRGSQASSAEKAETSVQQRPTMEPKESFRPSLPGAWASYTTNTPPNQASELSKNVIEPHHATLADPSVKQPNEDAFAKAAAAGSALAGAFTAAAAASATAGTATGSSKDETEIPERASKINTTFHPEAARLSLPRNDSNTPSSIVPTPLDMKPEGENNSEYFGTVQPLQPSVKSPMGTTLTVPQGQTLRSGDDMSTKSSPTDLESDRLRKEIVRELSPQREDVKKDAEASSKSATTEGEVGYSSIYDSYLDDEDDSTQKNSKTERDGEVAYDKIEQKALAPTPALSPPQSSGQPMFSSTSGPLEDVPEPAGVADMTHTLTRAFSWETPIEILPLEDFRSSTATTVTKNISEPQVSSDVPLPPVETRDIDTSREDTSSQPMDFNKQLPQPSAIEPQETPLENSNDLLRTQTGLQQSSDTILPPQSTAKVPAFKEIMAIQSTPQRILVYDQTRATFANMETGLSQWIEETIRILPEHQELLRNGGVFPVIVRPPPIAGVQGSQGMSSGPRPSFGPSTSKNVKGKDLLHSAGVFGGKTSSAAKGLFAKGKSKWGRGADKASKRFRGLSSSSNADSPSKLYEQQENVWETDASVPQFSNRQLQDEAPVKTTVLATENTDSPEKLQDDFDVLDTIPSNSVSPPTTSHLDSPTLGRSNTVSGVPISPLSGKTSFERKRASLAQKRASMEVPGSVRSHGRRKTSSFDSHHHAIRSRESIEKRLASTELQARLTVHQNQMRSFAEDFPSNLIIPAEYRLPDESENTPKTAKDAADDVTPTQADFPKNAFDNVPVSKSPIAEEEELKKNERKAGAAALWLDTTGVQQDHAFDGPASPDYALRPQVIGGEESETKDDTDPERPPIEKHFSSLSFIQFDPIPSEHLALNVPITPKRFSAVQESPDAETSSQPDTHDSESSFADYPAAEDFGALPSGASEVSSTSGHERSSSTNSNTQQDDGHRPKLNQQLSEGSNSTRSRNSTLGLPARRLSTQLGENSVENSGMTLQENPALQKARNTDSVNSFKRHSMLSDIRESREIHSYAKEGRSNNRKSLLGLGLGMKGNDSSLAKPARAPKFSLIPSARRRVNTDLASYEADPARPSLTLDGSPAKMQRAATLTLNTDRTNLNTGVGMQAEKTKKKRFSGLSSFINKAKPRISAANSSFRGRSNTPTGSSMKGDSVTDLRENDGPARSRDNVSIVTSQNQSQHQRDNLSITTSQNQSQHNRTISRDTDGVSLVESTLHASRDQLPVPASHIRNYTSIPDINSNRDAVINKLTAPPEEGADYKSVYPPEFFGEQPPEGYYSPDEDPSSEASRGLAIPVVGNSTAATEDSAATAVPSIAPTVQDLAQARPSDTASKAQNFRQARKPSGPRPMVERPHDAAGSEGTASPPPPPPPKDPPKHSVTTTTTTISTIRGPTKTTTETETETSQPGQYDSQTRGRSHMSIGQDSFASTNIIPASPIVQMATTNTVTRIANGRSVSPRPRNQNRSSISMIAPLNISKRSTENKRDDAGAEDQGSNSETVSGVNDPHRTVIPQLSVNTYTGSSRPTPIEQTSQKADTTVGPNAIESSSPPASSPPVRTSVHPFMPRRSGPILQQNSNPSSRDQTPTSSPNKSSHTNHIVNTIVQGGIDSTNTRRTPDRERQESGVLSMDDPVTIVQPLTIRKSPDLGNRRSPELSPQKTSPKGLRKSPNLSLRDGFPSTNNTGPIAPLPQLPNRISLHSPVLKDSPTLPRSTPPSSNTMTPANASSPRVSTTNPPTVRIATPPPIPENKETIEEEAPVSPIPLQAPAAPTGRAMTPVEKMKDEPGVNEPAKESDESEDEIVMSSTAYPGQEWRPDYGYGGWDGYE